MSVRAELDLPIGEAAPMATDSRTLAECLDAFQARRLASLDALVAGKYDRDRFDLSMHLIGVAERVWMDEAAIFDETGEIRLRLDEPTDDQVAAGTGGWDDPADLKSEELEWGLRGVTRNYRSLGGGRASIYDFLARLLDSVAGDIHAFGARDFAEWDARQHELWASQFQCRECGARA